MIIPSENPEDLYKYKWNGPPAKDAPKQNIILDGKSPSWEQLFLFIQFFFDISEQVRQALY